VGCAVLSLMSVAWPAPQRQAGGPEPFRLYRVSAPPGPVVISSASTSLLWQADVVPPTDVTLKNELRRPRTCETWWIVAAIGAPTPWNRPVIESRPVPFTIGPSGVLTVQVNKVIESRADPGFYQISFWVHCLDPSTGFWAHSDGATMAGAVELLTTATGLRDAPSSSRLLWVDAVQVPQKLVRGQPAEILATIANGLVEPITAEIRSFLSRPGVAAPWAYPGASRSSTDEQVVAGGRLSTVSLSIGRLPVPGRYVLSVWLSEKRAFSSFPVDGVWLTKYLTVAGK
jgi:hypothetical protein